MVITSSLKHSSFEISIDFYDSPFLPFVLDRRRSGGGHGERRLGLLVPAATALGAAGEMDRSRTALREVVDLKSGRKRNPDWVWDYDMGATTITGAAEIVIERKTGLRQVVQLARSGTKARKRGLMARRAQ